MKLGMKILMIAVFILALPIAKGFSECPVPYYNFKIAKDDNNHWGVKDNYKCKCAKAEGVKDEGVKDENDDWILPAVWDTVWSSEPGGNGINVMRRYTRFLLSNEKIKEWGTVEICFDVEKGQPYYDWIYSTDDTKSM